MVETEEHLLLLTGHTWQLVACLFPILLLFLWGLVSLQCFQHLLWQVGCSDKDLSVVAQVQVPKVWVYQ